MRSVIFDRVAFAYAGGDEVIQDISLSFTDGWAALVGDNGAGKSTLLALAAGAFVPSRGRVRRANLAVTAVVEQRVDDLGVAVHELAVRTDRDAVRWRSRLALDPSTLGRWPTLSPGERKRWQLAAALSAEPDLLVIDEPTNHLDADALACTIDALAAFRGIGLLVSHDRALLARLPSQTVRVHAGTARGWPGNYDAARAAWDAEADAARRRRAELSEVRRRVERQVVAARDRERAATRATSAGARMKNKHDSDARSMGATTLASWAAGRAGREVDPTAAWRSDPRPAVISGTSKRCTAGITRRRMPPISHRCRSAVM